MATEQDHVWAMLDDMLVFLSKRHVPTPERTYKLDGGWTLAMDDLRRFVDNLTAERDQLRAELAAAKEERDRQYEYNAGAIAKFAALESERDQLAAHVERLEKALDPIARAYRVSMEPFAPGIDEADGAHHWMPHGWPSVADFKDANTALAATPAQSLEAVTAPLKAHVERLVGALECVPVDLIHAIENGDTGANVFLSAGSCKLIGDALAATPAQSLAAHDAALLREVMNLIRQTTPDPVDGVPESFGAHQGRMYAIEQIGAEADRIERDAAPAKEGK